MNYPIIKKLFNEFLRRTPGAASAGFVGGDSNAAMPAGDANSDEDCPFVLVAHSAGGQWDVYAKDFEHPLASFDERQAGCDFATNLANARKNAIVLIRDPQSLR